MHQEWIKCLSFLGNDFKGHVGIIDWGWQHCHSSARHISPASEVCLLEGSSICEDNFGDILRTCLKIISIDYELLQSVVSQDEFIMLVRTIADLTNGFTSVNEKLSLSMTLLIPVRNELEVLIQ